MSYRNYTPDPKERALVVQLREARLAQKITAAAVTDQIPGYRSSNELAMYELGHAPPSLRKLIPWAAALGFELKLVPITDAPLRLTETTGPAAPAK